MRASKVRLRVLKALSYATDTYGLCSNFSSGAQCQPVLAGLVLAFRVLGKV